MRLPDFLTRLSPVSETLFSIHGEETRLAGIVNDKNRQLSVSTAEAGLPLWEADYALPSHGDVSTRRARIRAAIASGPTMTPEHLQQMAITVGGADRGFVEEDFARHCVTLYAVFDGREPANLSALEEAVSRLKPAHLTVTVRPTTAVRGTLHHYHARMSKAHLTVAGQIDA